MKKKVIHLPDTNVVLRYLLRDNEEMFEQANAFFLAVMGGEKKAVLLESVLTECVYVLTKFYEVPRGRTATILQNILQYRGIDNNDRQELIGALEVYKNTTVDPVDCILYIKGKQPERSVFSFDSDLDKLSR